MRVTAVLSGQWNLVRDKYLVLPGAEDLCGDIGTPATSSPIASTSSQNKPKKKRNSSSNADVCYNHIMPMGGKISFISVSLENPSLLTLCMCCNFLDCAFICLFFLRKLLFVLKTLSAV